MQAPVLSAMTRLFTWPIVAEPKRRGRKATGRTGIRTPVELRPEDHARWKASGRPLNELVRIGLDALNITP